MPTKASPALTVAPRVTFTPLPFGGAVLVNGRTLELIECDEQTAETISALLTHPDTRRSGAERIARLIDEGWLVRAEPEVPR